MNEARHIFRTNTLTQTQKDLPTQFLSQNTSLTSTILLASFSSTPGYSSAAFTLALTTDSNTPFPISETPLRYGKLPEIHHVFRADPKSPNVLISLIFSGAVVATLPILAGVVYLPCPSPSSSLASSNANLCLTQYIFLGANIASLPTALSASPLSHVSFLSSIAGIEAVFFLYYTSWNLFQTLPALGVLGVIAFLSGSRALSEVQERRLSGKR